MPKRINFLIFILINIVVGGVKSQPKSEIHEVQSQQQQQIQHQPTRSLNSSGVRTVPTASTSTTTIVTNGSHGHGHHAQRARRQFYNMNNSPTTSTRSAHPTTSTLSVNAEDTLNRINVRLGTLQTLDEQNSKRLETLEYKIARIEQANNERIDMIRAELREVITRLQTLDRLPSQLETTFDHMKSESEIIRQNMNVFQMGEEASPTVGSHFDIQENSISDRVDALTKLVTQNLAGVNDIKLKINNIERNISTIYASSRDVFHMQKNLPNKQFINNAILGLRSQPAYAILQQPYGVNRGGLITDESPLPSNCKDITSTVSSVYKIYIDTANKKPFYVFCDMDSDDGQGAWTVIQNRYDGEVDFFRNWMDYRQGFGNLGSEFWIGLDKLHELTSTTLHELLIEIEDYHGNKYFANYAAFAIGDEREAYALNILGSFRGTIGDALTFHAGQKFSTYDVDNDLWLNGNCAQAHLGAWWYKDCDKCNLNGKYLSNNSNKNDNKNGNTNDNYQGMYWRNSNNTITLLKRSKMMIRPIE